ncbi:CHAT domain-containing protein [Erythrobacter sp. YJ-T3-07]|uniref:CHAT domain-containing tetratricopeptide repeat protein n=1 Tax=Erythrobacter sp. YJ-T3-07 TaxID=2793063 RepID=UPI0018D2CB24|nr:CHAT domain-containing tetratricopeptide repeat protein [Erythrobacter sp. YJ-T3-07]MBH1943146.1 CHAT domain-containing protein [Erythrobacter sp. YJ-T3-07]
MKSVFAGFVASAIGLAAPALSQDVSAEAPETPGTRKTDLEQEITAWVDRDINADPEASLAALLTLEERLRAGESVAPLARGQLYMLLVAAAPPTHDNAQLLRWLETAQAAYREAGDPADKRAEILNNRAILLRRVSRYSEGEPLAREALAIRQQLYGPDHEDVASAWNTLANLLYSQGKFDEAVEAGRAGLQSLENTADVPALALVQRLDTLASLLDESGRSEEALRIARRAESLARAELGEDHRWYQYVLNTLGQAELKLALYDEAIPHIRRTVDLRAQQLGQDHPYTQASVMVLASALEDTGKLAEADALASGAMAILADHTDLMDANTLAGFHQRLIQLAARQGAWEVYDARYAQGAAILADKMPEDHPALASFHLTHAMTLEARGEIGTARALAERWVPILVARYAPESGRRILGEMLLLRLRQRDGASALGDSLAQADAVLERIANQYLAIDTTDRELARNAEANEPALLIYLDMAVDADDADRIARVAQIFNLSDLSLARTRRDAARSDPAEQTRSAILEIARRQRLLDRRISLAVALDDQQESLAGLEAQRARLAESKADAIERFRTAFPAFADRHRPRPVALADLAARLGPADLLVMPVEGTSRGYVVILDATGRIETHRFDTDQLAPHVAAIRRAVDTGIAEDFPLASARALGKLLLPANLSAGGEVRIFGGRRSAEVPFALLLTEDPPDDGKTAPAWLIESKAVLVLAGLDGAPAPADRARGRMRFAGIGAAGPADGPRPAAAPQLASLFRSGAPATQTIADLPPLDYASRELAAIAALFGDEHSQLLIGADAAEERLKQADLSRIDVLVFATHGLVSGELRNLWEPALLVGTTEGSGEDGLLGASEIARLDLNADWVILSACNTAAGDSEAAPVYSGLATAFVEAGARSLMLSHWPVRDDAAARLSVDTVRGAAAGLSHAEALRQAQLAMIHDPALPEGANPALWAPFVLIGG